jgi:hypothetical protein
VRAFVVAVFPGACAEVCGERASNTTASGVAVKTDEWVPMATPSKRGEREVGERVAADQQQRGQDEHRAHAVLTVLGQGLDDRPVRDCREHDEEAS